VSQGEHSRRCSVDNQFEATFASFWAFARSSCILLLGPVPRTITLVLYISHKPCQTSAGECRSRSRPPRIVHDLILLLIELCEGLPHLHVFIALALRHQVTTLFISDFLLSSGLLHLLLPSLLDLPLLFFSSIANWAICSARALAMGSTAVRWRGMLASRLICWNGWLAW